MDDYNALNRPTHLGNAPTALLLGDGIINRQYSAAGQGNSADTTDDTLFTYTLPANALDQAGRTVRIRAWGSFLTSGNSKEVKLWFGGSVISDSGVVTDSAKGWMLDAEVVLTSVGNQTYRGNALHDTTNVPTVPAALTKDCTAAQIIKVTGAAAGTGAAGEVLCNYFEVRGIN